MLAQRELAVEFFFRQGWEWLISKKTKKEEEKQYNRETEEQNAFSIIFKFFCTMYLTYLTSILFDSTSLTFIGKSNQILFGICHFHEVYGPRMLS